MTKNKEIKSSVKIKPCKCTIFFDRHSIVKTFHNDDGITLDRCLEIAKEKGYTVGIVDVIFDWWSIGIHYQYGNHGDYWVEHGKTNGLS